MSNSPGGGIESDPRSWNRIRFQELESKEIIYLGPHPLLNPRPDTLEEAKAMLIHAQSWTKPGGPSSPGGAGSSSGAPPVTPLKANEATAAVAKATKEKAAKRTSKARDAIDARRTARVARTTARVG